MYYGLVCRWTWVVSVYMCFACSSKSELSSASFSRSPITIASNPLVDCHFHRIIEKQQPYFIVLNRNDLQCFFSASCTSAVRHPCAQTPPNQQHRQIALTQVEKVSQCLNCFLWPMPSAHVYTAMHHGKPSSRCVWYSEVQRTICAPHPSRGTD